MVPLLILGIMVLISGGYFWQTNRGGQGDPKIGLGGRIGSIIGVVLIIASIILGSLITVPAGHRGIVIRFGDVTGTVLEEGLQTKLPFIDSVLEMSVRTEKYEVGASAITKDLQDVSTTIALNWRLEPAAVAEVYRTLGREYISRIAAPAIQETVKKVTAEYNAEDLIQKREVVKNVIFEDLAE
ncbi:MAG: prohibitin family protein [Dehalococcoidia bacterium]